MAEQLFKVLDGRRSMHGGTGSWRPGRWRSVRGVIVPCERGLHLCRARDLVHWLGPDIWLAEADGEVAAAQNKVVARRARITVRLDTWNERTARLFAAWCAEQALVNIPAGPARDACANAIEVARRFADGEATEAERMAAESAAESAARSATWSAAGSAARSATWVATGSAAWVAAWSATGSAARSATWSATWSAAWSAQSAKLAEMLGIAS